MILLAIDPGTNKTGLAFFKAGTLSETFTLATTEKTPLARRLDLASQVQIAILNSSTIASEEPFLQGKANTGMQRFLGMLESLCGGQIAFYHPMSVKKALGSGSLDKMEVALAAGELLQSEEEKEILANAIAREAFDETDAVAIGLTYLMNN